MQQQHLVKYYLMSKDGQRISKYVRSVRSNKDWKGFTCISLYRAKYHSSFKESGGVWVCKWQAYPECNPSDQTASITYAQCNPNSTVPINLHISFKWQITDLIIIDKHCSFNRFAYGMICLFPSVVYIAGMFNNWLYVVEKKTRTKVIHGPKHTRAQPNNKSLEVTRLNGW